MTPKLPQAMEVEKTSQGSMEINIDPTYKKVNQLWGPWKNKLRSGWTPMNLVVLLESAKD